MIIWSEHFENIISFPMGYALPTIMVSVWGWMNNPSPLRGNSWFVLYLKIINTVLKNNASFKMHTLFTFVA